MKLKKTMVGHKCWVWFDEPSGRQNFEAILLDIGDDVSNVRPNTGGGSGMTKGSKDLESGRPLVWLVEELRVFLLDDDSQVDSVYGFDVHGEWERRGGTYEERPNVLESFPAQVYADLLEVFGKY